MRLDIQGLNQLFLVDETTGLWSAEPVAVVTNSWLYTWGFLAAKCLGQRDMNYGINCIYAEFENVASPSTPVSIPSFNLQDDRSYYENLSANPTRDYLRIPLQTTPMISVAPGYESYFTVPGTGNVVTISAQSSGTVGMTGKPFSDSVNSKLCGVALVAAPVLSDRTQDVIFARSYYATNQQQVKTPNGQFGIQYPLTFGATP